VKHVTTTANGAMTGADIIDLCKQHTLFEWSAQSQVDPIPVARSKGVYFWTPEGKRYLDFNSQLMCVNVGHGEPRVIKAIQEQAEKLAYASPFMATEVRAKLGAKLASIAPGDIDVFFFTNGGADANENAIKIARAFTGRHKILARYRSYHGGSHGAMSLTGDPRRWSVEPGLPGVVHVLDPYHGITRGTDSAQQSLAMLEEIIQLEGAQNIAAFFLETVSGTNGILIPPDGYMQGLREICDRHGILLVADEVMAGFGRTGRWFAVDHWDVVPDLLTMAKGLTSSYLPLGAVAMRHGIAEAFDTKMFYGGLTYSSHPMSLAAALATIRVYEEDGLIDRSARMGAVLREHHERLAARHPSVGAHRNLGLFGIVDLVRSRDPWTPMTAFNGTSDEMKAVAKHLREHGLYTLVVNHSIFTNPPLTISEDELAHGFEIIDAALDIADQAVTG
jgi:taurine--2-oxoglutarate transaminase